MVRYVTGRRNAFPVTAVLVSFSETTTPGSAGESKKNYIVKSPPDIIEVRSANCTNKIQGGLFRWKKISQACNTQHGDAWTIVKRVDTKK